MKLMHVVNGHHLFGGARQVQYLLEGLCARGIECVLVCPQNAALAAAARRLGVRTRYAHCRGVPHLRYGIRILRLLKEERPDLLHVHSRFATDWYAGLAAALGGVPAVLSRRVDAPENVLAARLKYRLYARTICISEGIGEALARSGVDPRRLRRVRSAIDPAAWRSPAGRAALCRRFGLDGARPLAAVVAQLIARKGHGPLFEALRAMPSHERPQVVLFGRGALEGELRARLRPAGLDRDVVFAGFVDDLPRWLGAFDLLIHPATAEGLGVALLQAAAAGVPIVASRTGGIPEVVRDGDTGFLVACGDVDALRRRIAALCADAALRQRLGAAARQWVDREFSLAAMIDGNCAVYRETLGGAGR